MNISLSCVKYDLGMSKHRYSNFPSEQRCRYTSQWRWLGSGVNLGTDELEDMAWSDSDADMEDSETDAWREWRGGLQRIWAAVYKSRLLSLCKPAAGYWRCLASVGHCPSHTVHVVNANVHGNGPANHFQRWCHGEIWSWLQRCFLVAPFHESNKRIQVCWYPVLQL